MIVYRCRACDTAVTEPVRELTDVALLRQQEGLMDTVGAAGEPDYVPAGHFADGSGETPIPGTAGWPLLNPDDTVETTLDTDVDFGCCGPIGEEVNTDCANGHKIGIERGDCWSVHCVALDPDAVYRENV